MKGLDNQERRFFATWLALLALFAFLCSGVSGCLFYGEGYRRGYEHGTNDTKCLFTEEVIIKRKGG